jgi:hypothetical protein
MLCLVSCQPYPSDFAICVWGSEVCSNCEWPTVLLACCLTLLAGEAQAATKVSVCGHLASHFLASAPAYSTVINTCSGDAHSIMRVNAAHSSCTRSHNCTALKGFLVSLPTHMNSGLCSSLTTFDISWEPQHLCCLLSEGYKNLKGCVVRAALSLSFTKRQSDPAAHRTLQVQCIAQRPLSASP